ncbi:M48 family metalloprotease [Bradyrhizobium sp. ISRA443]|uniref:M48 family metalloprotease n=1 Tax=unclassified Bradyrhizobium TaxID=2631580 RepID=UPI00247A957B|nr:MULTISPECIES: M48 family metalloprotease [unclassified Bradyrhizobium]WGR95937.1 M48 family metalloprotease [Bradyrhizobium sp. ISRA435]WGS02907.1 M48 family metalloprotease [Bradyrhizobium sp. ISRA436]WGS09792.1 M48 family metalloprotease [Bradyrhizobium sp. ISRA437]WGS16675.1 M48 family metalloprotease [Bradyrhizobium sp. ISRA443]
MLAACSNVGRFEQVAPAAAAAVPVKPNRVVQQTPATEHEHERILSSYGGAYDDPKLEALISKIVDRLVAASERPDQTYKVTILNSGAVNAFALPTGQLYVTRGLIALASDTSELSSVLSHEMAHVLAKHASIREDQARQAAVVTRVVTDMSNDPDLTALALAKTKLTMASFSRQQEFEADGIGVGISARAHFDPYGAARFLTAMERNAALKIGRTALDPRAQDFLSSHPATPERVANAQAIARQYTSPENNDRDRETYLAAIDNIVYGEDPSEGFVRGRRFLHPKLGFTFTAPDTFTLDNTAQAVIGVREGGSQAMRFDVVRVPAEQSLGDYLNSGWMEGVEKSSTEDLNINGFPAASATAHGDQWQFKVYALRFGTDVYRFIFAAKQKTTESERNARETVNSFRRLTLEEIQAARPLRIKVINVQPGDTVESLSHRMAGVDHPTERFRVLNGLDAHAQVKPRDRVKIVVD